MLLCLIRKRLDWYLVFFILWKGEFMKVYKDIDEVIKPTEVPKKLWEYEKEMKKKPKFDKVKINKKEGKPRIK